MKFLRLLLFLWLTVSFGATKGLTPLSAQPSSYLSSERLPKLRTIVTPDNDISMAERPKAWVPLLKAVENKIHEIVLEVHYRWVSEGLVNQLEAGVPQKSFLLGGY